jgi:CTP:molybdopterin cytidylyltransferase MocA
VDNGFGPWVRRALDAIAGCDPRFVVVGASADEVAALLPADVFVVHNPGYAEGMSSSLRLGLQALKAFDAGGFGKGAQSTGARILARTGAEQPSIDAALVMLVDLPGIGRQVIRRVAEAAGSPDQATSAVVRACFHGVPGHPVLLGRQHWPGVIESAVGDRGARDYLSAHPAVLVECADIGSGEDVDVPP